MTTETQAPEGADLPPMPTEVWEANSKTGTMLFHTQAEAKAWVSQFSPSIAGGFTVQCRTVYSYPAAPAPAPAEAHGIEVSVGRMTESNGRVTWMVMLHRQGAQTLLNGHQVYSSHIEGRAQYEAAALRHFLGQGPEPDILDYDTDGAAQADVQPKGTAPLELTCSHANRSYCALYDPQTSQRRPPAEWYRAKIAETEGLDDNLPCGALAAQYPAVAHAGDQWQRIVDEVRPLIGRHFKDAKGMVWTFFGVVDGDEDYYYGMHNTKLSLLSCVGSIEGHGFELIDEVQPPVQGSGQ